MRLPELPWRVERRGGPLGRLGRVGPVGFGLVAGVLIVVVALGEANAAFFENLWLGTLGTPRGTENLMILAFPLILAGLAASVPYRLGLWNIGGEGQILLGAWGAAGVAFLLPSVAPAGLVPLMLLGAIAVGAIWILVPALARVWFGLNEIITTLLLNFVAISWMLYWAADKWREPLSPGGVKSERLPAAGELGEFEAGTVTVPVAFVFALLVALAIGLVVRHTRFGYELRMLGASERAARYAGMPTRRLIVAAMLIGGAMAGLAGAAVLMGEVQRYGPAVSNNTGYTGIMVAVLAAGSEVGVVAVALVFAAITIAGNILRVEGGASSSLVFAMFGLALVLAAIGQGAARFRLVRRTREKSPPPAGAADEAPALEGRIRGS
ncbi:MAG: ABC transporter permease [Thermoleophilaceae bacterium]